MPQRVWCKDCGELLFSIDDDLVSPVDVMEKIGELCPACGRELLIKPLRVSIKVHKPFKRDVLQ